MEEFLARIRQLLMGRAGRSEHARRALERAHRARATLVLEPPTPSTAVPIIMETTIEQVWPGEFVINQPLSEGMVRQLVKGEPLRMSFSVGELGHMSGKTQVLGRIKVTSGGGTPIFGYRLAIPERLRKMDRRRGNRTTIAFDLAREVELYPLDDDTPMRGVIQNVSLGGMQIRMHETKTRFERGQRLRMIAYLPAPVGNLNRMVTIVRVANDRNPRMKVLGVKFERRVEGLAELIESQRQRRDSVRQAG